jgi:hypothetical protein
VIEWKVSIREHKKKYQSSSCKKMKRYWRWEKQEKHTIVASTTSMTRLTFLGKFIFGGRSKG